MAIIPREWKTKDGKTHRAWVVYYRDRDKKLRQKTFRTYKAADEWEAQTKVDLRRGVHIAESVSNTVEQTGKPWIERAETEKLEPETIRHYRQHLEQHIVPLTDDSKEPAWQGRFGDLKVSKIKPPIVDAFRLALLRRTSAPMAKKLLSSLKMILNDAVRRGSIPLNPARSIQARDDKRHKRKIMIGVDIPAREEMRLTLSTWPAALDARWRPLLIVAAFCGLRSSELRALEWSDVADLESSSPTLRVRQRADMTGKVGSTKSIASQRTIPLSRMVAEVLIAWREVCPRAKLDNGSEHLHLVFPNGNGRVENHANIANRGWKELQRQAGVTRIDKAENGQRIEKAKYGVHSLRHFFASLCIDSGMDAKRLQELLGHSTIQMTLDTYSHLFPREADIRNRLTEAAASVIG